MIFDTDIVVWMLRKHPAALSFARTFRQPDRNISAVTHLELLYGCRDNRELKELQELLEGWFSNVVPLTPVVTETARKLMTTFVLSRRPDLGDVLIAATALDRAEPVATCNRKHFDFIPGLELELFRP